jgi:hypothetical protein
VLHEGVEVVVLSRVQKERFSTLAEYEAAAGQFVLSPYLMTKARKKMAVLHPLPRYLWIILVLFMYRPRPASLHLNLFFPCGYFSLSTYGTYVFSISCM